MQKQLPHHLEALVLQSASAQRIADTELVQSLWSDYGSILRCTLEGSAQESLIVKHVRWPTKHEHPRGWNSDIGHKRKVRSYEVESAWYENYASECNEHCRVPESLLVRTHDNETFMVLEDLDASGYGLRSNHASDREMRACLFWLAQFHATFLGRDPKHLWPIGTYWHLATRPEELSVIGDTKLGRAAAIIDQRLNDAVFKTFVHGDAKLANFCFSPNGERASAVDFQYVGGGCGMKDVAYFISSCLDENECERREGELLDYYFQSLQRAFQEKNTSIDFQALEREWRNLYPVAWTDFYRFLQGWSPGHWKIHRYSERLAQDVLASL